MDGRVGEVAVLHRLLRALYIYQREGKQDARTLPRQGALGILIFEITLVCVIISVLCQFSLAGVAALHEVNMARSEAMLRGERGRDKG